MSAAKDRADSLNLMRGILYGLAMSLAAWVAGIGLVVLAVRAW